MKSSKINGDALLLCANDHVISRMEGLLLPDSTWVTLDGKAHSGIAAIQAMWLQRWSIFPDFQVAIERLTTIDPYEYVHARYFGSKGSNKSLDMAFSTAVLLEMVVQEKGISVVKEFGDPTKMRELEDLAKPIPGEELERVSGLGGVFMKAKDLKSLTAWYDAHLGTKFGSNTWSTFKWRERYNSSRIGRTEFSMFASDTDYFEPSEAGFMFNFRVHNLEEMLHKLTKNNVTIVGNTRVFEYGKFAWIMDPEGNKIELWEPIDQVLEAYDAS